jgi:TolB-like protein
MSQVVRFDCFEADLKAGQLRRRGMKVGLPTQSFQVLASLLEHPGQVVTRDELQHRLWNDEVFVDFEHNLNTAIARLREALADSAAHPRFIETLPKRGYRFIGDVSAISVAAVQVPRTRTRLLVLPFVNLCGDAGQEYFSDAMTDEIITALANLMPGQLAVIARTTSMHYKGSHKDVAHISRELSIDYIVEGGVIRGNDRITVNVQLIRSDDQTHRFARKYDAAMGDVFSLHEQIAQDIGRRIPEISEQMHKTDESGERLRKKPTEDLVAYNYYIRGRHEMFELKPQSIARAKQFFEAALEHDQEFALAYCGLAQLFWYIGFWGFAPSKETDPVGRFYALRAIEIDDTLAESHALLSYYPKQRLYNEPLSYYDWAASLKDVERARELNPESPLVQLRYAIVLMVLGRNDEAAAELEHGLGSDPLSIEMRGWLIIVRMLQKDESALTQALRLVELEQDNFLAYFALGGAYLSNQKYDQSVNALRKAADLTGNMPIVQGWLGLALGLGGNTSAARDVLDRLYALAGQRYVPPTSFAWTYLGLGEIDEAFNWMDRAVDAPDRMMSPIKTYPFFDPLRDDPRFTALLHKMNLHESGVSHR